MLNSIIIKPKYLDKERISLELKDNIPKNIKYNNNNYKAVYSNYSYSIEMKLDEEISNFKIFINDKQEQISIKGSEIYFISDSDKNEKYKELFNNYYGYFYIVVEYIIGDKVYRKYTDWIDIYVRDKNTTEIVKSIVKYIYNKCSKYLYKEDSNILDYSSLKKSKEKNIYTKISLLEKIELIYEENLKFFKNYSYYENKMNFIIDDFEKLNVINSETIKFILNNPQYLRESNSITGIRYNKKRLIPIKTLILNKEISRDVYENKIVLGFLKSIYISLKNESDILWANYNNDTSIREDGDYTSSGKTINGVAIDNINLYMNKIKKFKNKFLELYLLYKRIFNCDEILINKVPKSTMNFMKFKHYQKVYSIIKEWFEYGNYNLEIEEIILSFNNVSEVYEYYILLNINEYLFKNKFKLINKTKTNYEVDKKSLYKNTIFENTFLFAKDDLEVYVFYQPVISSEKKLFNPKLGLFRNNIINYDGVKSYYYAPDYVIKISKNSTSKYIILDAKFSKLDTVIKYSFNKIAYKYVFSISTANDKDEINDVWIINSQTSHNDNLIYNLYNSEFSSRNIQLKPRMNVLTLNPKISESKSFNNLSKLFQEID